MLVFTETLLEQYVRYNLSGFVLTKRQKKNQTFRVTVQN